MTNVTDIFLGNEIKTNTFFGLLGWTIVWAILATFTNYILGMLLAVAINSKLVKLKQVWRTCFVIAIAIPQFVSLLLISRALEPAGAVNVLLQELGLISAPLPFLLDPPSCTKARKWTARGRSEGSFPSRCPICSS